jgi:hypothetical protein
MHGFPLRTAQCSAKEKSVNHVAAARALIRRRLYGHIAVRRRVGWTMEGKARFIFPVVATALIVFFVSAVVTFANIGFRADFVPRWLSAFGIGWPVAAIIGLIAFPLVRRVTNRLVALIEGK